MALAVQRAELRVAADGFGSVVAGALVYCGSTLIVLLGAVTGWAALPQWGNRLPWLNWDGQYYHQIASSGYLNDRSMTAFFPGFPLAARILGRRLGIGMEVSLLIVAHAALLGAFIAFAAYSSRRLDGAPKGAAAYALLALAFFPTTLFFRAAYSEAVFLLIMALVLYGIVRRWPISLVAAAVGIATATRPVGVALVPMFALYAWRRAAGAGSFLSVPANDKDIGGSAPRRWPWRLLACAIGTLLCCWGILAYMLFQWHLFGDPLAFAKAQAFWRVGFDHPTSMTDSVLAVVTLEPLWSVYLPWMPQYWARFEPHRNPIVSLQFANPIYFLGTIALVVVGWRKKWLNDYELLLSAGLLLIPYVTRSYDNAMSSFGRFSAVVLPSYLVMGHCLARVPGPVAAVALAVSVFFLAVYSALFVAGYRFI